MWTRTVSLVRGAVSYGVLAGAVALLAGFAWPMTAVAQVDPDTLPGVIDKPPPEVPPDFRREPVEIERLVPERKKVPGPDEVVATISRVNFKGASVVSQAALQGLAAKYLNRPITRDQMAQLKFEVVRLYYNLGYILVRAVTPPQDLSDGVLDMVIYEARIGNLEVRNDDILEPWVVDALTAPVVTGEVFHERVLESAVNDFNDFNNIDATLNLRPGKTVGTTDLLLSLIPVEEDEQRVSIDNYGSELTGEIVGTLNLEKSNFFGIGDKFDLDIRGTDEATYSVAPGLKIPTGYRNLMFDTRYLRSEIQIGDRLEALNAEGQTEILDVAFSKRFINMRRQVLQARLGFQAREHQSFQTTGGDTRKLGTDDDIRQVFLENSYLARFPNLFLFGSLRLAKGVDVLGAADQGEADATNFEGDPEVFLVQPLVFANYRPVQDGELRVLVSGQKASNKVLSSDLFVLGGYGSVRGFEPAETTGEDGIQFSAEYSHTVWSGQWGGGSWTAGLGPFVDGGHVWNRADAAVQDNTLLSAGLGVTVETGISNVGTTRLRFDWAHPLGGYNSPQVDNNSFYFQLSQTF